MPVDAIRLARYIVFRYSHIDVRGVAKKRRHLKGPGYEKLHEPMGVARVESHRDSGLAGLPMGPTIRRTGIERRAGRPLPEPDVDALAISHYGRAVPVLHRSGVRGRMETVLLVRLGRELEQVI